MATMAWCNSLLRSANNLTPLAQPAMPSLLLGCSPRKHGEQIGQPWCERVVAISRVADGGEKGEIQQTRGMLLVEVVEWSCPGYGSSRWLIAHGKPSLIILSTRKKLTCLGQTSEIKRPASLQVEWMKRRGGNISFREFVTMLDHNFFPFGNYMTPRGLKKILRLTL